MGDAALGTLTTETHHAALRDQWLNCGHAELDTLLHGVIHAFAGGNALRQHDVER